MIQQDRNTRGFKYVCFDLESNGCASKFYIVFYLLIFRKLPTLDLSFVIRMSDLMDVKFVIRDILSFFELYQKSRFVIVE
jgi:hypothetical protein